MKRTQSTAWVGLVASVLLAACASPKQIWIRDSIDSGYVKQWAAQSKETGRLIGETVQLNYEIADDTSLLRALNTAMIKVMGKTETEIGKQDVLREDQYFVVCLYDGTGLCYLMTKMGERAVAFYKIGTIAGGVKR